MTTKVRNKGAQRAILKRLLQLHVDHSTIVDGLSLADVSTTLNLSRAETEAHVETHISEGYLYSTIDTDHYRGVQRNEVIHRKVNKDPLQAAWSPDHGK